MSKSLSKKAALAKGVLLAVLTPKIAADKMPDLNEMVAGISRKNWLQKKPGLVAAVKAKLGADADIENLVELLDSLDGEDPSDNDLSMDDDSEKAVQEILDDLRGKISDEDLSVVEGKLRAMAVPVAHMAPEAAKGAADEPPEFEGKPAVGKGPKEEMVSKAAMDAAIKAAAKQAEDAAIARANEMHEARKVVAPYVGELAGAFDSAESIYKATLKMLGIKTKELHPSAYRSVLEAQPKPGSGTHRVAQDSAKPSEYAKFCEDLGLKA